MIQVIPVIYLHDGKAVTLARGNVFHTSVLNESPKDLALKFASYNFHHLFVIDVNGLISGKPTNHQTLNELAKINGIEITFGGGIKDNDDVRLAFENGASKVTASSVAVNKSDLFSSWMISYGRRKMVLSADVIGHKIARLGDSAPMDKDINDFINYFYLRGILYVKCSDISSFRDNTSTLELYKNLKMEFPDIELIAGGGVTYLSDLQNLESVGVSAALIGKAFYDGTLDLKILEKSILPAA
ncbi:MAG: hypothetical protein K2Q22_13665 [Cytophagales bacterium]|nr:hypothetical protein [Cytophagales bacterium]